jgi:hypothetical protein
MNETWVTEETPEFTFPHSVRYIYESAKEIFEYQNVEGCPTLFETDRRRRKESTIISSKVFLLNFAKAKVGAEANRAKVKLLTQVNGSTISPILA